MHIIIIIIQEGTVSLVAELSDVTFQLIHVLFPQLIVDVVRRSRRLAIDHQEYPVHDLDDRIGYLSRRYLALQSEVLDYALHPALVEDGLPTLSRPPSPLSRIDASMRNLLVADRLVHIIARNRSISRNSRSRASDPGQKWSSATSRCDIKRVLGEELDIPRFEFPYIRWTDAAAAGRGAQREHDRFFRMRDGEYLTPL